MDPLDVCAAIAAGAGWWDRNAVAVQAMATVVLIVVTGVYVLLTRKIAIAAGEQTKSAMDQADAAKDQAVAAAQQASAATAQVDKAHAVLVESARANLSALTSVATVLFKGSPIAQADGTSIGNVRLDQFDRMDIKVEVRFVVRNDGEYPTLFSAVPPVFIDEELSEVPDFVRTYRDCVLLPHGTFELTFVAKSPGRLFREWAHERIRREFEFETRSPLTGVTDHHTWKGTFGRFATLGPPDAPVFAHQRNSGFEGGDVAYPLRLWPHGFSYAQG